MDYFIVKQDPDLKHVAKITNWDKVLSSVPIQTKVANVEDQIFKEYPDFYDQPGLLIAKRFKKILSLYQEDIKFQTVVLFDKKDKQQTSYDLIRVPVVDCMSGESKTQYDEITELVLDLDKIGNYCIFEMANSKNQLIVRLDVAESLLRRGAYGVVFEKVKLYRKEMV